MFDTLNISSKIHNYNVYFIDHLFKIQSLIDVPNTVTFIDSNVSKLYPLLYRNSNIIIDCTEDIKSLKGIELIFNKLIELNVNLNTHLIVIGGGILQDLIGFCASTYGRGITYDLVPTTLLSQADSCIGGKTSINFNNRKNIIGTFYPPKNIFIYVEFLKTLKLLDIYSGLGEIYKYHILQNKINEFDYNNTQFKEMIYDSLLFKKNILNKDEFDKGERKYLNFGHTFGHALETISNNKLPHGIAVILGCIIASKISKELNYIIPNYEIIINKGIELFKKTKIKKELEWFNIDNLLKIIESDKKNNGNLTMVLLVEDNPIKNITNIKIITEVLRDTYESI